MSTLKKLLVAGVESSRLYRAFSPFYGGHTSVILLHRVKPATAESGIEGGHAVTPEFLERFILEQKSRGGRFISLDYLVDNFDECSRRKRNLVVTLDDGYLDNFQYALPLFRKHSVPFTVYVTTSFPNGTADLWWYKLAWVVSATSEVVIEQRGERVVIPVREPRAAFRELRGRVLAVPPEERSRFVAGLMEKYGADYREERFAMSWDEIVEMSRDRLCTIGSHTVNHGNLRVLDRESALREMLLAREELEERIGLPVLHFSYPYGTRNEASAREESLAKEAGFTTAVTTRIGNIFAGHIRHLHMLPRIPLQEGEYQRLNGIYLSGMYSAAANRFRRVVTH